MPFKKYEQPETESGLFEARKCSSCKQPLNLQGICMNMDCKRFGEKQ